MSRSKVHSWQVQRCLLCKPGRKLKLKGTCFLPPTSSAGTDIWRIVYSEPNPVSQYNPSSLALKKKKKLREEEADASLNTGKQHSQKPLLHALSGTRTFSTILHHSIGVSCIPLPSPCRAWAIPQLQVSGAEHLVCVIWLLLS